MLKKILSAFKRNHFQFQPHEDGWFLSWSDEKPADDTDTFRWAYQLPEAQMEQAIYLAQLATEGVANVTDAGWLLPWGNLYALLSDEEYNDVMPALDLPTITSETLPSISCKETLSDPDFEILIQQWRKGEELLEDVELCGGIIHQGKKSSLLPESAWRALEAIHVFNQRTASQRNQREQELAWGKIRRLIVDAQARFASPYLKNTLILTPETLQLSMDRKDVLGEPVVTVKPLFEGAPEDWLTRFDRLSNVQPHYDFSDSNDEQYRVILSEPVRKVLDVIKRDMPYRRVVGRKAEAFLRNPYALLGEFSHEVLDEDVFTREKEKLGSLQQEWSLAAKSTQGWIVHVDIRVGGDGQLKTETIDSSPILADFLTGIEQALTQQELSCKWRKHQLLLDHQSQNNLAQGERILAMWEQQEKSGIHKIRYEDIYDLGHYGERVIGIAEAKPIAIPVLLKPESNNEGWAPELEPALLVQLPNAEEPVLLPATQEFCTELGAHLQSAQEAKATTVELPYLHLAVPIEQADHALRVLEDHLRSKPGEDVEVTPKEKPVYQTLIIETNFGNLDYIQQRKHRLTPPDGFAYELPDNLRPEIKLKPHQLEGVKWLQYLVSCQGECHGALLADDMGLGKTLQLLCLLATFYEASPNSPPSMIVAPVSLLDNWEQEVKKFFDGSFPEVLRLHGQTLKSLKQPKELIDKQLLSENISNLLQPNWPGAAKLIITTYETIRDYEFSLARQDFEFLICDEAQKIKNPTAMVTLAVKKQKARFKIACTGTPVENNLVDLWCLFDWIQPSLLGTLQAFHTSYRRPIEVETESQKEALSELRALIEPQVLRRMKKDLAKSGDALPEKIEVANLVREKEDGGDARLLNVDMSDYQHGHYQDAMTRLGLALGDNSGNRSKGSWAALHRMKAICAEPYCQPGTRFKPHKSLDKHLINSPKISWLINTLKGIREKQEKAIIFTDLREVQRALTYFIHSHFSIDPSVINGKTQAKSRQKLIDEFQAMQGFNIIILSPLAAGAGLNIVAANHVIHFTRTWNPAKEAQATDRAYRIGQEKTVYVYCPTVTHSSFLSFEEKLDQLMRTKAGLADDMLNGIGNTIGLGDWAGVAGAKGKKYESSSMHMVEDIDTLDGTGFELFCAFLLKEEGWMVEHTGGPGDGGADVVAFKEQEYLLVQCKHSTLNKSLNWDAVKEVVASRATYQHRFPGKDLSLIAVTNRAFNSNAHDKAGLNQVQLWQRDYLVDRLIKTPALKLKFDAFLEKTK